MIVVVSDANIIIDLLQIDLFAAFLKLDWEKHVPPDVADEVQEDNSYQLIDAINEGRLARAQFNPSHLLEIQKLKAQYPPLSVADCSCIYMAENLPAILLTGERRLRSIATDAHRLEVHGTLWVMEILIEKRIVTHRLAHAKLSHLMKINNRLPQKECTRLLRRWEKNFEPLSPSRQTVRKIRIRRPKQT